MADWVISLVVGLCGGLIGAYVGLKVGLAKLQIHMQYVRERLEILGQRSHVHNEDLLVHDMEIDTLMGQLAIPRAKRQRHRT